RIARLDAQEEAVLRRARKLGNVKYGMIRLGKTVQDDHAKKAREGGDQHRQLERDRDVLRPAMKWAASDVERIIDRHREPLHDVPAEAARGATEKNQKRHGGVFAAKGPRETLDWKRRIRIHFAIAS